MKYVNSIAALIGGMIFAILYLLGVGFAFWYVGFFIMYLSSESVRLAALISFSSLYLIFALILLISLKKRDPFLGYGIIFIYAVFMLFMVSYFIFPVNLYSILLL